MGVSTIGVLAGRPSLVEVAQAVRDATGAPAEIRPEDRYDLLMGHIFCTDPVTSKPRMMWVFNRSDDFPGNYTCIHLDASDGAVQLIRGVVEKFGGYINPANVEDDWEPIACRSGMTLGPTERLQMQLSSVLPVKMALELAQALEADGAADALVRAVAEWQEARAQAPTP